MLRKIFLKMSSCDSVVYLSAIFLPVFSYYSAAAGTSLSLTKCAFPSSLEEHETLVIENTLMRWVFRHVDIEIAELYNRNSFLHLNITGHDVGGHMTRSRQLKRLSLE